MIKSSASIRRRSWRGAALLMSLLLLITACGSDEPAATTGAAPDAGSTTAPEGESESEPFALPVIDATAAERCERFGYPCTWAEAGDETLQETLSLSEQVLELIESGNLEDGFDAAEELLTADERVVEAALDREGYTAVMLRLDGGLPAYVFTPLAAPLRDPSASPSAFGPSPQAGVVQAQLASFEITREPAITPRKALVLDPYAAIDAAGEGNDVVNIFASHPDFTVEYVTDSVGPAQLSGWSSYDAVHVTTHGSSWCPEEVLFRIPDNPLIASREIVEHDLDRCHSGFGAGAISNIDNSWQNQPGMSVVTSSVGGTPHRRLFVSDEFFAAQASMSETVVFLSSCQGGGDRIRGGRIPMVGMFGSFLGWDNNVSASATANTAREFWRLMAVEGLEFELAVQRLEEKDLNTDAYDRSTVENFIRDLVPKTANTGGFDTTSMLVSAGKNLRIRDVVTTFVDGAEISDGSWIATETRVEDGVEEYIPEVKFRVEGVKDGDEATALIEVIIDGDKKLDREIRVSEGTVFQPGSGWNDWEITVEKLELPFDLTVADVDPANPRKHTWEARVVDTTGNYSARKANPVFFSGGFEAAGPIPILEQLGEQITAVGGSLEGNELVLEFRSDGGPVTGELHAVLSSDVAGAVGWWDLTLTGTYDAQAGTMQGDAAGSSFGDAAGITASDSGTGTWEAVVDLRARTVTGVIGVGDSSQSFVARFR
jgi:hypothetical protein